MMACDRSRIIFLHLSERGLNASSISRLSLLESSLSGGLPLHCVKRFSARAKRKSGIGLMVPNSCVILVQSFSGNRASIPACIPPRIGKEVRNELSQLDDDYMVDEFEFEELEEALVDFAKEVLEQKNAEG